MRKNRREEIRFNLTMAGSLWRYRRRQHCTKTRAIVKVKLMRNRFVTLVMMHSPIVLMVMGNMLGMLQQVLQQVLR